MQIVATDGYTLNPGDLSWDAIAAFGDLQVFERTPVHAVGERCKNATIILTNKVPVSREVIKELPQLRLISVLATGYNVVDTAAAKEKGILVCNVPAYGTASVAQHVFALLLELTNRVGVHAQSTAEGEWQHSKDWSYTKTPLTELSGKTFGVVGFGHIGQQVARIAAAFGMKIIYFNPNPKNTELGEAVDLEALFAKSDVISLHCPLKDDNFQFVNKQLLFRMKKTALLINTARGPLINEEDLKDALNNNIIAGAGLDVLSKEPPVDDNPLLHARNCIVTPHNAWMSKEARQRIMDVTAQNISAYMDGRPVNVVNG